MNKQLLKKYAELVIKKGVNLQKGEILVLRAPVLARDFALETVKSAYRSGAKRVEVLWTDEEVSKMDLKYCSKKTLSTVPEWIKSRYDYYVDERIVFLAIRSSNPEAFKGIKTEKIAISRRANSKVGEKFDEYTSSNKIRWCLCSYPNKEWAKKMFNYLPANVATTMQMDYIAKTLRLDNENPIKAWEDHQNDLQRRCKILNDSKIMSFTYKNSLGTNLTIGMPKGYIFCGGAEKGELDGVYFTANMPTEEVFSCPDRNTANGKVVASMPLCHNGQIIRDFWFEFKDGRIVDFGAKEGYDNLKSIIDTDEGSHYLGEIALVGYNSPIRNLDTLFYDTLFDENASCHFAIGGCYPTCLQGGADMTTEEQLNHGLNDSLEHVDFMIGTKDLEITAKCENGEEIQIFTKGDWVF